MGINDSILKIDAFTLKQTLKTFVLICITGAMGAYAYPISTTWSFVALMVGMTVTFIDLVKSVFDQVAKEVEE